MRANILVVDSDGTQLYALCRTLDQLGYHTEKANTASAALQCFQAMPADIVFVDLNLSFADGIQILKELRDIDADLVAILTTVAANLETALAALRNGAFDYLVKPIRRDELSECVERGLKRARFCQRRRRLLKQIRDELAPFIDGETRLTKTINHRNLPDNLPSAVSQPTPIQLGELIVYPGRYQLQSGFGEIDTTPTEFDLLLYLAAHLERTVPCHELVRELRGYQTDEKEARNLIRPHISNLRRKLRKIQVREDLIANVHGVGYRLALAARH